MTDRITIRRGDDESLTLDSIVDEHGNVYELQPGDYLTLSVRELPNESSPLLLESTSDTMTIRMPHALTSRVEAGVYSCDISLFMRQADGSVLRKSVLPDDEYIAEYGKPGGTKNWKNFIVNPEVGNG